MSFTISRIADYGTGNPILARLHRADVRHSRSLRDPAGRCGCREAHLYGVAHQKLVRCYEIAQRFQAEFVNEMETYRRRPIRMAFSKQEAATLSA
jgi:hypothetical protein